MTKNLNWFLKVLNQMFGPETNRDKEQNTLSSVAFTILSYRKAIGKLIKHYISNYPSVHKFHQPVSSITQKYHQFDCSLIFVFSLNCPIFVMNFWHRLIYK